jgi:hypothetical protein
MTLTPSQHSAFYQFEEFINSNDRIFILKGSAGTGKTTLLKAFVDSLNDKGWKCVLMAPTGRASFILGEKTGHSAATIHRTIYRIEEGLKDDGSGQLVFGLGHNEDSLNNTIYFVDEASMVSDLFSESDMFKFGSGYLLRDVMDYCGSRKVVFVGDYAQLPPVGQAFSPAMSAEYLHETYHASCREAMLKEVVRQVEDSFVYKNATFVRDAIESSRYNEFAIKDGEDVKKSEALIEDYKNITHGSIDQSAIVISYTNKQVLDYNLAIRKYIFQTNQERLVPGDLLIVSQNNYHYSEELYNGTIVRVLSCGSDTMLEKRTVRFNTSKKDAYGETVVAKKELSFRKAMIETASHNQVNCLILDCFITDALGSPDKEWNQALIVDFSNRMRQEGIAIGSEEYCGRMKTDPYLHALICKYGYAITCHKAQGGEWEKVFVDMDKIGGKQNNDYFRWAYTAITRSSKNLWHFASPEFNAVSNMAMLPISKTDKISYFVPQGENFLDWHFQKIGFVCAKHGVSCVESRNFAFQHLLTFEKDGKQCVIKQWYNKSGYTPKRDIQSANDKEFAAFVIELIGIAMVPEELPFEPDTEFSSKLHEYVMSMAVEMGVSVLNISQAQWKDIYYLKTTPYESLLTFNYNIKGMYSSVSPQSTGGTEDKLLQAFCERIQ